MDSLAVSDSLFAMGNTKFLGSPNLITTPIGCNTSTISAENTVVAKSTSPKHKRRSKLEIFPSRLHFDTDVLELHSNVPKLENSEMEIDHDHGVSTLRDAGIRHFEEDQSESVLWQQKYDPAQAMINEGGIILSSGNDNAMEDCFTPTAANSEILLLGQHLARPTKKGPTGTATEQRSNHFHQNSILCRQDFTHHLRPASDLDYNAHYEYIALLGSGQFGEVWSVRHRSSSKLFALKKSINQFRGRRDQNLFIKEIKNVSDLVQHKNVVKYVRAWQDAGHFYIVMELCAGGTLRGLIDRTPWIPLHRIRVLMQGCLDGLALLHANQLIHMDLKPDNLFLSEDGGLKIGDFGLCRKASDRDAEEGDGAYLAPEVLNNPPTVACDIFSAGLILFQLLHGVARLPSHGLEWQRLRSGSHLFPEVPAGRAGDGEDLAWWGCLACLCSAMLAPSSELRPTAQQCLTAACFAGLGSQGAAPAP